MSAALARSLAAHLPPGIGLGWSDPRASTPAWPGEQLPAAIPRRQTEFAAGRHAARQAMAALGAPPTALPAGRDRAPLWPAGLTGSITHSDTACLALAVRLAEWPGIGIDIEPATPLAPELWPTILAPSETAIASGLQATLIFAAKESAFKAQYRQSGALFGFETLHVSLGPHRFTARFTRPIPPFAENHLLHGFHLTAENHLIAVTLLPPS